MKAAVEVFIPTSEERPRFGPVEWMWKEESSESYGMIQIPDEMNR